MSRVGRRRPTTRRHTLLLQAIADAICTRSATPFHPHSNRRRTPMDFDFSPDQHQLKDQARRYLADHCSSQAVRVHF